MGSLNSGFSNRSVDLSAPALATLPEPIMMAASGVMRRIASKIYVARTLAQPGPPRGLARRSGLD